MYNSESNKSTPTGTELGYRDKSILIAGRLAPQKNIQLAIKAFYKFSKIHNDYVLKIFGQGPQKNELESLIRKLGITSKVRLEGFSDRIYEEMNKAGMYLSTSNYEGISNSMLEALGLGMPVIVTDCPVGGARQYVKMVRTESLYLLTMKMPCCML